MSSFADLSKDLQRLICLYLDDVDLRKIENFFDDDDTIWKEKIKLLTHRPQTSKLHYLITKSYVKSLSFQEHDEVMLALGMYEKYVSQRLWNEDMATRLLNDEIYLQNFINCKSSTGETLLDYIVCDYGSPVDHDIVRRLIKHGARTDRAIEAYCISGKGDPELLKILVDASEDEYLMGFALYIAVKNRNLEYVKILLDAGIKSDSDGGIFGTPLRLAMVMGYNELYELLKQHQS